MSESTERAAVRALDPYAQSLRDLRPSAALDERMGSAIAAWAQQRSSRRLFRRPLPWIVTAASVAVITAGVALLLTRDGERNPTRLIAASPVPFEAVSTAADIASSGRGGSGSGGARMSPLAVGQVSLYPAESAIFRVKASFASNVSAPQAGTAADERQYWVDVRIASDGTMRIMQVIPAERGRVVPRE